RKTLADGADVRALWNHDDSIVLGRTKSGTLRLEEDSKGLKVWIDPPKSAAGYVESIRRGDVDSMSFGFVAVRDKVTKRKDGTTLRELLEVKLFDVSPVAFPAYSGTTIEARNVQDILARAASVEERRAELDRMSREIREAEKRRLDRAAAVYDRPTPKVPES